MEQFPRMLTVGFTGLMQDGSGAAVLHHLGAREVWLAIALGWLSIAYGIIWTFRTVEDPTWRYGGPACIVSVTALVHLIGSI